MPPAELVGRNRIAPHVYGLDGALLAETDGAGAVQVEYVYLEGAPLAVLYATGTVPLAYVHPDPLGAPRSLTNTSGVVVWRATYDPFGQATVEADPDGDGQAITFNLRLPGQYYDAETGLHYNYQRYYDPTLGRYTTVDPIGLRGGLNPYVYANANPLRYIDPRGLYGTKNCTYYDQACAANQGTYECKVAPALCPKFPDNDDPNGNSDKIGNWSECARQCLQERHKGRMPHPQQCSSENNISPADNAEDHAACWMGCLRNPENPYNSSGPNLPDGSPSLY